MKESINDVSNKKKCFWKHSVILQENEAPSDYMQGVPFDVSHSVAFGIIYY